MCSINNNKNEVQYSDTIRMFFHLMETRHFLNTKPKYFQSMLFHKELSAPHFNQEKSDLLKNIRVIQSNHGVTYVLGPSLIPVVVPKPTFSICICGHCNQQYRSLRKRIPRPRVWGYTQYSECSACTATVQPGLSCEVYRAYILGALCITSHHHANSRPIVSALHVLP